MSGAEVLVLGGTGFVGQAVLAALRADGRAFTWVARIGSPPAFDTTGLPAPILIDDLEALDLKVLDRVGVIVDLVSRGRGRLATRRDILGRVRGHARLIDDLANRGWGGHYVYLSSGGTIYGIDPPPVCVETMQVAPFSDYALEKAFIEMHLQSVAGQTGMGLSILRVANAYGEGQPAKPGFGVIPAIAGAIASGVPFKLYGDGTSRRDYVHVDDIVAAIFAAIARGEGGGEGGGEEHGPDAGSGAGRGSGAGIVNIGSGVGTSVRELIDLAARITGRAVPMDRVELFAAEPQSVVLDATRARERLGWQARIGIAEGLARILAHHGLARPPSF